MLRVANSDTEIRMTAQEFMLYPKYTSIFTSDTDGPNARFFMSLLTPDEEKERKKARKKNATNMFERMFDTSPRKIVTLDIDYTKDLITLPQLCHLSQSGKPKSSIYDFIKYYTCSFNWFLQKLPEEEREQYCKKIMAGSSIEELFEKYPEIVSSFVESLIIGTSFEVASSILDDFVTCVAKRMSSVPDKLLEYPDFFEHQNVNAYLRLQNQNLSCYLQDCYDTKIIDTRSEGLMAKYTISPLPESEGWQAKHRLIECLLVLEQMAAINKRICNLKKLMLKRLPKEIVEGLLQFDVFTSKLFPKNAEPVADSKPAKASGIVLSAGASLSWAYGTYKYIECDVVPSDTFLQQFDGFLERCRTSYSAAAMKLKEYLDAHQRPVNHQHAEPGSECLSRITRKSP